MPEATAARRFTRRLREGGWSRLILRFVGRVAECT
jgi:hypothetical protein